VRKRNIDSKKKVEAERLRLKASAQRQEDEYLAKAFVTREAIRGQFDDLRYSRQASNAERMQLEQLHVDQRLKDNEQECRANDIRIEKLVEEERALIQDLQNSKLRQRMACERLEDVMSASRGGSCMSSRAMSN